MDNTYSESDNWHAERQDISNVMDGEARKGMNRIEEVKKILGQPMPFNDQRSGFILEPFSSQLAKQIEELYGSQPDFPDEPDFTLLKKLIDAQPESPMYLDSKGQWQDKPDLTEQEQKDLNVKDEFAYWPDQSSRLVAPEDFADIQMEYLRKRGRDKGIYGYFPLKGEARDNLLMEAQRDLTAATKDAEWWALMENTIRGKDAELKTRMKALIEEIEGCAATTDCFQEDMSIAYRKGDIILNRKWWAKLKANCCKGGS